MKFLLNLICLVFKLKDNIYASEFEIITADDGCICVAAALSDGSAIFMFTDTTNVILLHIIVEIFLYY